jgi:8-oxo-dGTP pyrophosphatase MutT (NUDIX family)
MPLRQKLASVIRRIPSLMLIFYYLYRFIQPKYSIGVVGVVLNDNHEVLIVEHVFHPRQPWGLPGGWIGHNEDPSKTIKRELQEELGLDVQVQKLLLTMRTQYNHLDMAYLCIPDTTISKISYELLGYRWCERHKLPDLHSFHVRAIEQAFMLLDKGE